MVTLLDFRTERAMGSKPRLFMVWSRKRFNYHAWYLFYVEKLCYGFFMIMKTTTGGVFGARSETCQHGALLSFFSSMAINQLVLDWKLHAGDFAHVQYIYETREAVKLMASTTNTSRKHSFKCRRHGYL